MPTVSIEELVKLLLQEKLVIRAEFTSNKYETIVRYVHGKHSSNELALSLQRDSFLSHGTALASYGMAAPENTVYVNREQSPKDRPDEITQAGMRRAFRNKQRQSKYIFSHSAVRYMLLSGKHTGRAGVTRTNTTLGETVDVTDKERTLCCFRLKALSSPRLSLHRPERFLYRFCTADSAEGHFWHFSPLKNQ